MDCRNDGTEEGRQEGLAEGAVGVNPGWRAEQAGALQGFVFEELEGCRPMEEVGKGPLSGKLKERGSLLERTKKGVRGNKRGC